VCGGAPTQYTHKRDGHSIARSPRRLQGTKGLLLPKILEGTRVARELQLSSASQHLELAHGDGLPHRKLGGAHLVCTLLVHQHAEGRLHLPRNDRDGVFEVAEGVVFFKVGPTRRLLCLYPIAPPDRRKSKELAERHNNRGKKRPPRLEGRDTGNAGRMNHGKAPNRPCIPGSIAAHRQEGLFEAVEDGANGVGGVVPLSDVLSATPRSFSSSITSG